MENVQPDQLNNIWDKHRFDLKLVNPANKRKYKIIVVGTGLAGGAAAASLGELGYNVQAFCYQDSPRRAHSIAAQGGINAAKNYPNDGDSIYRLFYDTIKGGDFRAREADVWRLAQVSNNIIDQCVAQGVPFARDYAGYLDNRSFGGAQVSRTFYCPRPDRSAAAARRLLRTVPPDQGRHGQDVHPPRDARPGRRRWRGPWHHGAQPGHRRDRVLRCRCRLPCHRRLCQRILPFHQRHGLLRHRQLEGRTRKAPSSPIPATRRSTRPASRRLATTSPS